MTLKERIREKIKEQLNFGNDSFVIYPAGKIGILTKDILNYEFDITEIALVDNSKCGNDGIISFEELKAIDDWYVILLSTENEDIKKEIVSGLKFIKRPIVDITGQFYDGIVGSLFYDFSCEKLDIEELNEEQLSLAFERTTQQWKSLGEADPYWSVITNSKYRKDKINEKSLHDFYDSGIKQCDAVLATLIRNGIIKEREGASKLEITEIGCGCGRITKTLVSRFKQVYAFDISPGNIEIAKSIIQETNVEFCLFNSISEYENLPKTDVVFSVIVLQHNVPPIIKYLITKMLASLRDGGIGYFQVPSYARDYRFCFNDIIDSKEVMDMHVLPQKDIFEAIRNSGCELLECYQDQATGIGSNFISQTYVVKKIND